MEFVLDASVTLTWAFPDEWHEAAIRAKEILETPGSACLVPALWWFEVRNILIVNERRGRITAEDTTHFLNQLDELDIRVVSTIDDAVLLRAARELRLSVYDASYLAVALERQIMLATLDQRLEAAARSVNVSLLA